MSEQFHHREFALKVVRQLRDEGHESLWAGGCVRDQLLGKSPKDYDVATDAAPDRVREIFGKKRTIAVGAAFGVITVLGPKGTDPIEVATFRTDGGYTDGRRPDSIAFTSAEEDAKRRDFTINGLFYDPLEDRVIDYVGGRDDLRDRVVRAIGVAADRFAEDRLRMLRAVRFAASLGFALDPTTAEAIRDHAAAIYDVSPERIGSEVKRMLTEADPARAIVLLHETRLLPHVLPPLDDATDEQRAAAIDRVTRLSSPGAPLGLATALVDVADRRATAKIARSLRWTNKEIDLAAWLVEHHGDLDGAEERPWSEVQPLLAADGGKDLATLRRVSDSDDVTQTFCEARLAWPTEKLNPSPLVVGADLIAAGRRPGPDFAALLARARAAQLDKKADNRNAALREIGIETE